ncbi:MAG: hypothetical protein DWC10_01715 [Candidatus Poseidoniales archaeon]|nr:MAG: hypothetical protein DWC10_01715 [Candidatus Poseidoniales archaeon]
MEHKNIPTKRFADLVPSTQSEAVPVWAKNSRTTLAHGTGRLPAKNDQLGWQPVAGPGSPQRPHRMTPSMDSLRKRMVRGEA